MSSSNATQPETGSALRLSLSDFELGEVLGEGSYAQVILARLRRTGDQYALKVVNKRFVMRQNKQKYVMLEKAILSRLEHPGIVRLFATFQDHLSLYFVLELAEGGELLQLIRSSEQCTDDSIRFYCAEILLVLEYLHGQGVIHRDLKPENLLLKNGHIKLVDFGSAKEFGDVTNAIETETNSDPKRHNSFVGTAEYVPPELLNNKPIGFEADLWAFGCVIFQMYTGRPPFKGESEYLTFQKILNFEIDFPDDIPEDAKSLIRRLLSADPRDRIESGFQSLQTHPFFSGIYFEELFLSDSPKNKRPI